ncbi:MAG: cytochrome bc complex cytochrome b subunit [Planctomycetes bacterium]|nr:cytochrome bc complex cytochrome b subunit [Planctomycetota bacterium]
MSIKRAINNFFEERYDMRVFRDFSAGQLHKRLPPHTGWGHVFGSLALMLYISQVLTGILLLVYYRPTPEEAHESIKHITGAVPFGWFYRQLHAWGATLMIIALLLHMCRTYFMGAYKKPRELTWVTGVFLFMATITFGFTGYLLPWNELAYWATTVGTEVAGAVPFVGQWVMEFLRGGPGVGHETLSRFFLIHVIILPWFTFAIIGLHLFLMRAQNLATLDPVGEEKKTPPECGIPFHPVHSAKEVSVALLTFGILASLAVLSPWEIGEPANPLVTPEAIKPEWYFLPTYQLLKYFSGPLGKIVGIMVSFVPFILMFLWPFIDRGKERHPKKRPLAVGLGVLAVAGALFFGVVGHLSESTVTIFGTEYEIDIKGFPHRIEESANHVVGSDSIDEHR